MSKNKRATKATASKDSLRTRRRISRGFVSLEVSSRKHRRALRRQLASRVVYGRLLEPGETAIGGQGSFMHTAGGAFDYH